MAGDLQAEAEQRIESFRERYRGFRRGLTPGQDNLFEVLVFLAKFTVLAAPFYLALSSGWQATGFRAFTADTAATVLRASGLEATSSGSFVSTGDFLLDVTRDSTGWKSLAVFTALVLATRRGLRSKMKGVAAGAFVLVGLNVLRISSMVYAVNVYGVDYELMHTLLWRWGLTAAVIVLWGCWMRLSAFSPVFPRTAR